MSSNTVKDMAGFVRVSTVVAALVVFAGQAHADLRSGQTKFIHGDYAGAKKELAGVSGNDRPRAQLELARVHIRTGDYAEAEKILDRLAKSKARDVSLDAKVARAELYRRTGRSAKALKEIEIQVGKNPDHLRSAYVLGLLYIDTGNKAKAAPLFQTFIEREQKGTLDLKSAEELFYTAEAGRYKSHFQYANDTFRDAVSVNSKYLAANVEWGNMLLGKYSVGDAEQAFDEVLKVDPQHPDAHAGMAVVKLEQSYDIAAATHHIDKALEVNPEHEDALLAQASIYVDQNQWDKAKKTLAKVFESNPKSLRGRAMLATVYWLRDDDKNYDKTRKAVLSDNPEFAEFFHIVARSAVREHRYRQAIDLEKQAVKVDGEYYEAMEAIGTGYLRLGLEKKGLEWLRKSWDGDSYNVRTFNTLELYDQEIPNKYEFSKSKSFKWRFEKNEREILTRYMVPRIEGAFADMIKRYGFRPKTPVILELYNNMDEYSVRTVGLPNLGALGVCFGQVITAMSPSTASINWGMVVWHELAHVFAIQLSNSRVPRWFTEGLSEYETLIVKPEWRRENDGDLYVAMKEGTLPSVAELNYGFMKPSMQEVLVAYHLSSVTIEYIATNYGFPKIVEGLELFGKGKETPEVIEAITGKKVAEFDAEFHKYLELRLAPYDGTFYLPTQGVDSVKDAEIATAAKPKNANTWAKLAVANFYDRNVAGATKAASKALSLDDDNHVALWVTAELAFVQRNNAAAKENYEKMIVAGADNWEIRSRLAFIAAGEGDIDTAIKHWCTAKKLDPERSQPYQYLSELYEKQGRHEDAVKEMESYVMIEQMDYGAVRKLVDEFVDAKKWRKARFYGELALDISPFDYGLYLALGEAYLATGDHDKALFTYESALLVKPQIRRPAVAWIGRAKAFIAKGQKANAKKELAKALKVEPENAEALELESKL